MTLLSSIALITPAALLINQSNLGESDWDASQMKKMQHTVNHPEYVL